MNRESTPPSLGTTRHEKADVPNRDAILAKPCRVVVSLLVVGHLLAVLAEPFRFFTQSPVKYAAEEADLLRRWTGPYVEFMYLNHGYSFFAPNPGPSHLLECEARPRPTANHSLEAQSLLPVSRGPVFEDDQRRRIEKHSRWRFYPDRSIDRPRLLYHRYFMLAEFYHNSFAPESLENQAELDPELIAQWKVDRRRYESLQRSIRAHLTQTFPEHELILRRIEHALPSEYQVLVDHWRLNDHRLYDELAEGPPLPPTPEGLPAP